MRKIKREDEVIVLTGKDKGKRGKVQKVLDESRVLVSGINMIKKHQRPNPQLGVAGGIVEKEAPIQVSNVAIYNPSTNKADRVGFKVAEDGSKGLRVAIIRLHGLALGGRHAGLTLEGHIEIPDEKPLLLLEALANQRHKKRRRIL